MLLDLVRIVAKLATMFNGCLQFGGFPRRSHKMQLLSDTNDILYHTDDICRHINQPYLAYLINNDV